MSIHKNKQNNTWYVKYKNKTKRGFKTKYEAQLYQSKLYLSSAENQDISLVSYQNVLDDYLKYFKINNSYGTYCKCKSVLYRFVLPNIKNKMITYFTELDCRQYYDYVNSLSCSTLHKNYILGKYKAIFKHAVKYFNLQKNPSLVLDNFKLTYEEKCNMRNKYTKIWTNEEFTQFIACVNSPVYKSLFITLYYTGMRIGEATALKWSDFYDGSINIDKSLTRKTNKGNYEIKDPKNFSSVRVISLGKNLTEYLESYKVEQTRKSGYNDKWFIFGNITPLSQTSIDRVKDKAIKQANVKRITLHQFRHSHVSNLIANGVNIVAVSKCLGHSDVNMTLKVYTHLLKKSDDELIDYIDNVSQNLLKQ